MDATLSMLANEHQADLEREAAQRRLAAAARGGTHSATPGRLATLVRLWRHPTPVAPAASTPPHEARSRPARLRLRLRPVLGLDPAESRAEADA